MPMYRYTPKKTNKTAERLVIILFLAAALLLALPAALGEISYAGFIQVAGVGAIVAALAILTKYIMKSFTYEITEGDREGEYDLAVSEHEGSRTVTVCRVALSSIEDAVIETEENVEELRARRAGRKCFTYFVEMSPRNVCWVFVTECGEPLLLKLTPDDKLFAILKNRGMA